MTYRPGDVVNGHRLNTTGTAWEPLEPVRAPRRRVPVALILLGVLPPALVVALMQFGVLLAVTGYEAPEPSDRGGVGAVSTTPTPTPTPTPVDSGADGLADEDDVAPDDPAVSAWPTGVVTMVIDGDTVDVTGVGRVRVIGIDSPEIGECGYEDAAARMNELVLGREVTLVPGARDDRDRYDRLLRYLDVAGVDAGRELIGAGLAIARYDSRDGYGAHPREADYVALDAQTPDVTCPVPAPVAPAPDVPAPAAPAAEPWNMPGPDLDCADIGKKVWISGPDYHRLDADGDGWGCESYG